MTPERYIATLIVDDPFQIKNLVTTDYPIGLADSQSVIFEDSPILGTLTDSGSFIDPFHPQNHLDSKS